MLGAAFAENFNVKKAMVDSSLVLFLSFIDHQLPSSPKISGFYFFGQTRSVVSALFETGFYRTDCHQKQ